MTRDELLGVIRGAINEGVSGAISASAASSSPAQLAATEIDRDMAIRTAKRVKFWGGLIVALAVTTSGGITWVYSRGAQAQVAKTHETKQDERIGVNAASTAANAAASVVRDEKIRNLGALAIEQGNDQRSILIKSAPKAVREEMAEKPDSLLAAEGAVLRQ